MGCVTRDLRSEISMETQPSMVVKREGNSAIVQALGPWELERSNELLIRDCRVPSSNCRLLRKETV